MSGISVTEISTLERPKRKTGKNKKLIVKQIAVSLARYIFLIAFSYILLYPLFFMVSHSFRNPEDFLDPTIEWIPKNYSISPILLAAKVMKVGTALLNTLSIEIVSALIQVITCGIIAYGLARFNFPGKRLLMFILILTILVPIPLIIIPNYLNFRYFDFLGVLGFIGKLIGKDLRPNLIDTPWTFYLPSLLGVGLKSGFFIFIYIQFFKGVPKELEEAAWIDGAGPWGTYFRIIVPSSGVAVLTVTILSVIWHWNDYHLAQMYLSQNYTLAVELNNIFYSLSAMDIGGYAPEAADTAMAGCLMFITPVLIMYLFLQKKFITSIATTGIVG